MTGKVLLLNASMEPLRVVGLQRAVVLIFEEKVDVLEEGQGVLRSQYVTYPVPSVLRLRIYRHIPYKDSMSISNRGVLSRDRYRCAYCGKTAKTVDHIHPKSKGGKHDWMNVVAACYKCNNKKSNKTLEEVNWKLRYQPFVPRGENWIGIGPSIDENWQPYLAKRP